MKKDTLISTALIGLFILVLAAILFWPTGKIVGAGGLPAYASATPKIQAAYEFAVSNPEALEGINCYCGCMQHLHGGRLHSRGLHDCFLRDGGFEIHGSQCDMCINDALDVKKWTEQGLSKEEIKKRVDERYGRGG